MDLLKFEILLLYTDFTLRENRNVMPSLERFIHCVCVFFKFSASKYILLLNTSFFLKLLIHMLSMKLYCAFAGKCVCF